MMTAMMTTLTDIDIDNYNNGQHATTIDTNKDYTEKHYGMTEFATALSNPYKARLGKKTRISYPILWKGCRALMMIPSNERTV
jgi:hypothetical protein